ncbi:MAG TPA: PAC2 family protein [Candidatus Corynebacterium gallistercoris]|uniref:PAC2 family protein n=1 Tax=Candidatus Corynebacterium gallistercoris TaxID=2838530 RepID=A0A9D1RW47_9CORY|nr:PAC2 family protein [Candidatus Corynebacterium gallistercoris]
MLNNFDSSSHEDRPDNRMYELEYPAPAGLGRADTAEAHHSINGESDVRMPLVIALQGYADAGQAVAQASTHLIEALEHHSVASFNVDELLDYRSRRPGVTIDNSKVVGRENLGLELHLLKDVEDQPFLMLSGPEPDLKWKAFSEAVVELSQRTHVDRVISLYAAPMTVPHTRPMVVSAHSTNPELIEDYHSWPNRMMIPGAAALETELQLGKAGFETVGFTAHVPHYIAASDYPEATHALLKAVADSADRQLPLRALESDMARIQQQLAEQVEESQEIATVVAALEGQYDAEVERLRRAKDNNLLQPGQDVPTGEELGAEFEAFLQQAAQRDDDEDDE